MLLTIIVPTKNEARNIHECVEAVKWAFASGDVELVVVDNHSQDQTEALAREMGVKVVVCGPERSAQRNRGARDAQGAYVFFVDADMRVRRETLEEILGLLRSANPPEAFYVREVIAGTGYWNQVRNFERSFYNTTCIDGLRVFKRSLFLDAGGFDESLYAAEDWDLDRRIRMRTDRIVLTGGALVHDEGAFSLWRNLGKKRYYSGNINLYMEKWGNDETVRKQLGLMYRFLTVFVEQGKWKRALTRPDLMLCIWFYRVMVGVMFLRARMQKDV